MFTYKKYTDRQEFKYTAFFAKEGDVIAKVAPDNDSIGAASIKEVDFKAGDTITLVASTINGSELQGWSFDYWELNGEKVAEESEIKVTVPNEKVTYTAHFVKADTKIYCMLKSKSNGKYLKQSGTTSFSTNVNEPAQTCTGDLKGSYTLTDNGQSDPGCVFIVSGVIDGAGGH